MHKLVSLFNFLLDNTDIEYCHFLFWEKVIAFSHPPDLNREIKKPLHVFDWETFISILLYKKNKITCRLSAAVARSYNCHVVQILSFANIFPSQCWVSTNCKYNMLKNNSIDGIKSADGRMGKVLDSPIKAICLFLRDLMT